MKLLSVTLVKDRNLSGMGLRENKTRELEVRVKTIVSRNFVLKANRGKGEWLMRNTGSRETFVFKMGE